MWKKMVLLCSIHVCSSCKYCTMSTQLLALLRRETSSFTRGLSSSFYFKALRTLYKKGYWHLMNWIPETLHRSRLDFYMVEAVLHQYFEVIQSSRFFLKALLKKIVCELLLPRSHPAKHLAFPSHCVSLIFHIFLWDLCAMGRLAACLAVPVQEITPGFACCYHQVGK